MSELFDLAASVNDWRFLVALIGVSVVALAVAAALRFYIGWRRQGAVPVSVRVIDVIEERNGSDPTFKPEFEILTGIYKGVRYVSEVGSNPPDHKRGEEIAAHYQRESGVITSAKTAADLKRIANVSVWVALVAAACAAFFAVRLNG